MPDLIESLRNIEEDHYLHAVSTYFHIVVYSLNNSMYLLYVCVLIPKTRLMISHWESAHVSPLLWRTLGVEVFEIISTRQ